MSWWDELVRPAGNERLSESRERFDFDDGAFLRGEASGLFKRFARRGARVFFEHLGGSGTSDLCRYDHGVEINVSNCVLPTMRRRVCEADEGSIILRASLCCDVVYSFDGMDPITFNRPELTMVCLPKGTPLVMDARGGCRQQTFNGIFPPSALREAFELGPDELPPIVRAAVDGSASAGRIVSLPLDHRVAALVGDALDTGLDGEMRAVQYFGRLCELVAYALDAVSEKATTMRGPGVMRWRDADLAQLTLERLSKDYRDPPAADALAKDLGTNPNKLFASFKAVFGLTMAQYCLERRMREAQMLLLEGKLTVAQIAERVGYAHQSNFAAAFAAHVGMSPREYRRHQAPISLPLS